MLVHPARLLNCLFSMIHLDLEGPGDPANPQDERIVIKDRMALQPAETSR